MAEAGEDEQTCAYCFEGGSTEAPLFSSGCACRETLLHVGCLAAAAAARPRTREMHAAGTNPWTKCPACQQLFTGKLYLALCFERWQLVAGKPNAYWARIESGKNLMQALRRAGRTKEARRLGTETPATARRVNGDEHPDTQSLVAALALVHLACGHPAEALRLNLEGEKNLHFPLKNH